MRAGVQIGFVQTPQEKIVTAKIKIAFQMVMPNLNYSNRIGVSKYHIWINQRNGWIIDTTN